MVDYVKGMRLMRVRYMKPTLGIQTKKEKWFPLSWMLIKYCGQDVLYFLFLLIFMLLPFVKRRTFRVTKFKNVIQSLKANTNRKRWRKIFISKHSNLFLSLRKEKIGLVSFSFCL